LHHRELADPLWYRWIAKDRCSHDAGGDLFQQLQPFSAHAVLSGSKTRGIAARSRQSIDEASADRIGGQRKYYRDGAGLL
jgi:hypothetical protein